MQVNAALIPSSPRLRTLRTIVALILREIGASNGRSALGYLWEVVEPVAFILLLSFLFGLFLISPPLGQNFPLFYASGLLPYLMFLETANRVMSAVRFSRQLLTYPGVTFLDAILARFLLAVLTKLVVFAIVLGLIVAVWRIDPFFDAQHLALGLAMAFGLALGIGTLNCLLIAFFPLWEKVWSLVTRPLFLLSAVLYLFETVPLPYRDWLWWNPLVHVVGMVRSGLFPTYTADYVSVTYVAVLATASLTVGLFFLRRYWRELLDQG